MTDFPVLAKADLNPVQLAFWNKITTGTRGFYSGGPNAKRLPQLYNAYLQFPEFGEMITQLADAIRAKSELTGRMRELMVLTTSAKLGTRVEYDFHVPFAKDQGLSDAVIVAIGDGKTPPFEDHADQVIYEANVQLLETATLTAKTRNEVVELIGYPGLMQLMSVAMLYVITAYISNVAKVELADDFSADPDHLKNFYAGRADP